MFKSWWSTGASAILTLSVQESSAVAKLIEPLLHCVAGVRLAARHLTKEHSALSPELF
jgi:hypothetical protein